MARKELSEKVFKKCLNDKINLFENVEGSLEVKISPDRGSGDYIAEVSLDFGGPFFKKRKTWGYDSKREAEEESVDSALGYLRRTVSPNLVGYDEPERKVTLTKSFRVNQ